VNCGDGTAGGGRGRGLRRVPPEIPFYGVSGRASAAWEREELDDERRYENPELRDQAAAVLAVIALITSIVMFSQPRKAIANMNPVTKVSTN
jgi:hypothetical protein